MSDARTPENTSNLRAFFRVLVRILVVLILAILVGVGIYIGAPLAYRELVLPVRENTARMDALEKNLAAEREALTERLNQLQDRLDEIKKAGTSSGADLAALRGDLEALRGQMEKLDEIQSRLDELQASLENQAEFLSYQSTQVMGIQQGLQDPAGELSALKRQLKQVQVLGLLTRAQVQMAQNNFGLAREETRLARNVLVELREMSPADELAAIDVQLARVDQALANLPNFPILAAGDLEQAYQLLAGAVLPTPGPMPPGGSPSPTPATWLTETSAALTATAAPTNQGTITVTQSPTPTPFATNTRTVTPTPTKKP